MHLANLTTARLKIILSFLFVFFIYSFASAQENSPYSRYGLGDVVPNQNINTRGMGGISAAYSDLFTVNFKNPASLGNMTQSKNISPVSPNTIFDVGGEVDIRTLKSTTSPAKFTSTNTIISYLELAFPIAPAKLERKGINWGVSFGLRPITRINYKIEKNERLPGIDSLQTIYEGSGGVNQVNVSTGVRIKNFSFGISSGYTFGNKDYSTQKIFINDTVNYYKSNTEAQSHFGGIFINAGIQYEIDIKKTSFLKLGAYANFQQNLKARQDNVNETFTFDGTGDIAAIDTINSVKDLQGTIKMPANYGIGFTYQSNSHWMYGADLEISGWNSYRYYDEQDAVQNNWTIRAGAEYLPGQKANGVSKYWRYVKYRAGIYFGPDYIKVSDKNRPNYAATLGASFPLTTSNHLRFGDFVQLNTAVEIGGRGNKQSISFRENNVRISFGISMNANWFQKRSYY